MEKILSMLKDSYPSKEIDEAEDGLSEGDSVAYLNAELLATFESEVLSDVGTAKRDVIWIIVKETRRNLFLNGFKAAEEAVQDFYYQYFKYMQTHMVEAGTMDMILAMNVDKWSRSDPFMETCAHPIVRNLKYQEPLMIEELDCLP